MNATKKTLCLALICLLAMSLGCSKKPEAPTRAHYYPDCHEPLAYVLDRHSGAGAGAVRGAVQGGVISGLATAIAAAITGRFSGVGVAAGVGAGAAVGGLMGGTSGYSASEAEDNRRLSKYLEEIDGDIEGMDLPKAAATVSRQCYRKAFDAMKAGVASGKITPLAASERMTEIAAGEKEAAQLLNTQSDAPEMESELDRILSRKKG